MTNDRKTTYEESTEFYIQLVEARRSLTGAKFIMEGMVNAFEDENDVMKEAFLELMRDHINEMSDMLEQSIS
jgi:hypothetical protein